MIIDDKKDFVICMHNHQNEYNINKSIYHRTLSNKKAQIQIGESVAVIIFFTLLLLFTLVFLVKQGQRGRVKQLEQKQLDEIIELSKKLQTLNELRCTKLGTGTTGCIDLSKVIIFNNLTSTSDFAKAYYSSIFRSSKIVLNIVYAYKPSFIKNYTIYDMSNDSDYTFFSFPVQIYDPYVQKNMFGMLDIYYYGRH